MGHKKTKNIQTEYVDFDEVKKKMKHLIESRTDELDETCCPYSWSEYYEFVRLSDLEIFLTQNYNLISKST